MPGAKSASVVVRPPVASDAAAFLAAARASRKLHGSWSRAPGTPATFRAYLARYGQRQPGAIHAGLLAVRRSDGALVGAFHLSDIVRGPFQNAYLGYYAFVPFAGKGFMTEAFARVLDHAFGTLRLHRVEANVQPGNRRSIALVERVGFEREGYSRRYLKIAGRWRDHLRYAMLAEDWKTRRRERPRALP